MRITDDNLHGRVVLTADGLAIGELHRLFFHGDQFSIDAIEIKVRKEAAERLGLKHSTFHPATLEIPAGFIQSVGDAVILSAKLDDLRSMPGPTNGARDKHNADVIEPENVDVPARH